MTKQDFSRRSFLTKSAAAGAGAVALAGAAAEAGAQGITWDQTVDVVIIGAGVSGLPPAITARELGASVIIVEENYDIGGRGMLSGGRVQLGGGHALTIDADAFAQIEMRVVPQADPDVVWTA